VSVVQRLLARILPYIQAIRRGCGALARALLGEVDWHAPPWALWTAGRLKTQTRATIGQVRRKPREAALLAFTTLTIISGTYFTYRWYESLPRPVETGFTVTSPGITCYACEPVGKPDPLLLHFEASVAPLAMIAKDLDPKSEGLQMSPAMKGTWHWDSDRTLRFQPAEDWPIAAHFKINLKRHGLVATHVHLVNYDLTFNTPDFQAKLGKTDFYQDPVVATEKKVVVTVTFSHPVDPERFEKRISLTLFERITDSLEKERGKTPFTVIYDKQRLNAHIHSGQLAVPEKMGRLLIRMEPGLRAARGGNETDSPLIANVSVPGLHSLEISDVSLEIARNEREEPSQVLLISMNHSVLERDMPRNVHAWVLPIRNPDATRQAQFERHNHGKPFRWSQTSVNSDVLKVARPLRLSQVPGELEHYELHSFRHEAEPGEFVYIEIDKGLRSFGGYILDRTFEGVYEVPEYPRELRIAQQGSLLALSGDKALTIMTRGVATLHVEAGRLLPTQIQHLVTQTRGDFGAPIFNNYEFDASNITERFTDKIALPSSKPGTAHYTAISLARYLSHDATDHHGVFFMRVQAWDTEHDRPIDALVDTRLIVVTDLGLLAKKSLDGSQDVFVQSIHTGEPLADVHIEVLGRNGLPVLTAASDAEGHAHFPDLGSFKREQEPVLYLAHRNADSSFLPIQDRGRGLDLSRFDVGGIENRVDGGALSAYLFCDRGLYRPGEEIHAGVIVRTQDWKRSLEGIPLLMQITDPRGVVLRHERFKPGAGGFSEIRQPTYGTSPAGTYTFSVWVGPTARRGQPDRLHHRASARLLTRQAAHVDPLLDRADGRLGVA
jgi:alpha-2-macroglobulin